MFELNSIPTRLGLVLIFKNTWRDLFLVNKEVGAGHVGVWERKDKEQRKPHWITT